MIRARLQIASMIVPLLLGGCDDTNTAKKETPKASKDGKDKKKGGDAKDDKAGGKGKVSPEEAKELASEKDSALAAWEGSRAGKKIEVTAKGGTPDWFVQAFGAFRAGDIDPIVAQFAEDIEWEAVGSPIAPPSKGKPAVLSRWEDLLTGIPDMQLYAKRIFTQGNLVVLQVVLNGTNKGEFRGIPASNKKVGADVMAWIWHNDEGKANKVRVVYNEAAILGQMGKLEGDVPPIPAPPEGDPEVISGESDAKTTKALADMYAAGKDGWKMCEKKLCAKDYVHHDTRSGAKFDKIEQHKASQESFYGAFPDVKIEVIDNLSFGPDWVATFASAKGTHKGDMGPLKATNKAVDLHYSALHRFENGKIKESWGFTNGLEMLAALGLFEAKPKVAAKKPAKDGAGEP